MGPVPAAHSLSTRRLDVVQDGQAPRQASHADQLTAAGMLNGAASCGGGEWDDSFMT
jgi:hypothetical protein